MRQSTEISIDLTTQELLDLPADAHLTKIRDSYTLDLPRAGANTEERAAAAYGSTEVEVEIELTLTPAEMDAMLKGEWNG